MGRKTLPGHITSRPFRMSEQMSWTQRYSPYCPPHALCILPDVCLTLSTSPRLACYLFGVRADTDMINSRTRARGCNPLLILPLQRMHAAQHISHIRMMITHAVHFQTRWHVTNANFHPHVLGRLPAQHPLKFASDATATGAALAFAAAAAAAVATAAAAAVATAAAAAVAAAATAAARSGCKIPRLLLIVAAACSSDCARVQ